MKRNQSKVLIGFLVHLVKQEAKRKDTSIRDYGIQYSQVYEWCRGRVSPRFEKAYELALVVGILGELEELLKQAD